MKNKPAKGIMLLWHVVMQQAVYFFDIIFKLNLSIGEGVLKRRCRIYVLGK